MQIYRRLSMSLLAYLAHLVCAHASMGCMRIEELPKVWNTATLGLFDNYLKSVGASRHLSLREWRWGSLDETLLIAFPADQDCKSTPCYYRLLAVDDGELRERFSFQGTGVVLTFTTGMHIEHFHDIFFAVAFETADRTHLEVAFARVGKTILVSPVPQDMRLPSC